MFVVRHHHRGRFRQHGSFFFYFFYFYDKMPMSVHTRFVIAAPLHIPHTETDEETFS